MHRIHFPRVGGLIPLIPLGLCLAVSAAFADEEQSGCVTCHKGIEPIINEESEMMAEILQLGEDYGDPAGCVVCHGGDPTSAEKDEAHGDDFMTFFPDPGSPWVNEETCGTCHPKHVAVQWHSLMMTEAGKIQGVMWAFGLTDGYEHKYANYDVQNPQDKSKRLGTQAYREYMEQLTQLEPQVFVEKQEALPAAPTDPSELVAHPELAAFTYVRNQCERCHHAVKGRQIRGDYRGMGCSSCHIPYGNEGFYEGADPTVPRDVAGHSLVHSIQATRQTKVTVHGTTYSGIPVETCTTCHDRGKRIGVSFQGLMETAYKSPYTTGGEGQPALHTKHYIAMHQDIHYQKGMTCQDCHTSIDVHSDGFLASANLGAVQIECADCHGTPAAFPWELPLGFGDEFDPDYRPGPARGTAEELTEHVKQGMVYPPEEGYLITARGNPYTNVVRKGNEVIVHTAAGSDITLKPLKQMVIERALNEHGRVAMAQIAPHIKRMECYTCHASWAPQCYGCHVKIDYSDGKTCFDWLAAGHRHEQPEHAADRGESEYDLQIPGQVEEQRSYLRWEDPALGVNGEGRVTPLAPGCQPSVTVVGPDGDAVLLNHIFRGPAGKEGAGDQGQLAIDISPTQPHTMTSEARTCESCHLSEKALGHGIAGGKTVRGWDKPVIVDLETVDGHILPEKHRTQMEPIEGLTDDWSRIVTEDGKQLQTIGHHFTRSRPLNDDERSHIDRDGVCLACHREIPDQSLAVNLLHHVAEYSGQLPKTRGQHNSLIHKILLLAGWVQVVGMIGLPLLLVVGGVWFVRRRMRRRNETASHPPEGG